MRDSLLVAASSFILRGLLTRDKFGAVTAGMSGFDGMVQGLGESKWCVILGKKISVVPEETISPDVTMKCVLLACNHHAETGPRNCRFLHNSKFRFTKDIQQNSN